MKYKVRCSSLGIICAKKGFGKTGETLVKKEVANLIYERRHELATKQIQKGNICERESIIELQKIKGIECRKNEQRLENEWITGTPDVIFENEVIDVKNSFDHTTFPLFDTELDYGYEMQIKGYMWLLGMRSGSVDYFLNDMPEELLMSEVYKAMRIEGLDEVESWLYDKVKDNFTYSHLPLFMRYKSYPVTLSDQDIAFIRKNVEQANAYGNQLMKQFDKLKLNQS